MIISVIICTYNPDLNRIERTLEGLKNQHCKLDWELIIVDNNSDKPLQISLSWHPIAKIIREEKAGLTHARIRGFKEASGEIVILVDDDNILESNYLKNVDYIFSKNPKLGAIGGKIFPEFEVEPPKWINEFYSLLALRDMGEAEIIEDWQNTYPTSAPVGAGIALRKKSIISYIENITSNNNPITDRIGKSLTSGGDNELVLEILKNGWKVGYYPQLKLVHIIPGNRLTKKYLSELNKSSNMSWIRVLHKHHINPWSRISKHTIVLRKIKAWFSYKPWLGEVNYIKWKGACGMFEELGKE